MRATSVTLGDHDPVAVRSGCADIDTTAATVRYHSASVDLDDIPRSLWPDDPCTR